MKLILGSKSVGRYEVLSNAGYEFDVMVSDIEEEAIRTGDYELLPLLIARGKKDALLPKIKEDAILITSDQVVVWNKRLREKPKDKNEARDWLRTHFKHPSKAITSVIATNTKTGKSAEGVDIVRVYFKKIPDNVIEKLIKKGRILNTAGACVAEDPLLNPYIKKLEGDLDSLTGLPMKLTKKLLEQVGFRQ
jgi:septum formation protein